MQQKKLSVISIILFVLAGLLTVFFVWAMYNCYVQVDNAIIQGNLTVSGNIYVIVDYYMNNAVVYLIWAILLLCFGLVIQRLMPRISAVPVAASEEQGSAEAVDEEDFEDYSTLGNLAPSEPKPEEAASDAASAVEEGEAKADSDEESK